MKNNEELNEQTQGVEEAPELTEEDEALLDDIWAEIDRQGKGATVESVQAALATKRASVA